VMDKKHWIEEIDQITNSVKEEFGNLTADQLNWKPNPKSWSIGQVIDHLIVVNGTYDPIIKQLKEGTYKLIWLGRLDFIVRFFGYFILKSVNPDRKSRMKTLPIWEPGKSNIDANIVSRFAAQQSLLKEHIKNCSTLLDQGAVISSPANRIIVYKLERAFEIIVTHEQRHLEQARELNRLMKSKS